MMEDNSGGAHSVSMTDRRRVELSGIREVESFDDTGIVLISELGDLTLEGEALKIDSFSVDSGKAAVSGKISALYYTDKAKPKNGWFSRRSQ